MRSWRHAAALLLPVRGMADDARGAERACHWFVPTGVLIGLIYAGVYRGAWRQFGEVAYGLRLVPAAAVWLLDAAFFGLLLYLGAAATVRRFSSGLDSCSLDGGGPRSAESMALAVLVLLKLVLLVAVPHGILGWPGSGDWRSHLNWMYPRPYYRPLILAPIWGRWAMLLVGSIGRLREGEDARWSAFCGSLSAGRVLAWMVPVTVLTSVYCGRHGRWMLGVIISLVVLAITYLYGVLAARTLGGQDRESIRAGGLVAELTFLIVYEALAWRIYSS